MHGTASSSPVPLSSVQYNPFEFSNAEISKFKLEKKTPAGGLIGPQLTGLSMGRPNIYAFHVENLRGPGLVMGLSCIVRLFPREAQRQPEGAASSERLVASARRRHRRLAVPMEMEAAARSRVSAGARYRGCS